MAEIDKLELIAVTAVDDAGNEYVTGYKWEHDGSTQYFTYSNGTVNLEGLRFVDIFDESTEKNEHSQRYDYFVTLEGYYDGGAQQLEEKEMQSNTVTATVSKTDFTVTQYNDNNDKPLKRTITFTLDSEIKDEVSPANVPANTFTVLINDD